MNSSRTLATIYHGLSVAGHIVFSVLLTGIGVMLANPTVLSVFTGYVVKFGIPIGVVNVVVAMILKYIDSKPTTPLIIDSLPGVPNTSISTQS